MLDDARRITIDFYDAKDSESFDAPQETDKSQVTDQSSMIMDDDKHLHTKIGRTEIMVDKVI